jgi:hypothetical protein
VFADGCGATLSGFNPARELIVTSNNLGIFGPCPR